MWLCRGRAIPRSHGDRKLALLTPDGAYGCGEAGEIRRSDKPGGKDQERAEERKLSDGEMGVKGGTPGFGSWSRRGVVGRTLTSYWGG